MGVFDKLKNVFFEEEYVEVEEPVKKVKKEKKEKKEKPTIAKKIELPEMPRIREEKTEREKEIEEEVVERVEKKEFNELNSRRSSRQDFKFPMDFEEEDFTIDSYEKTKPVEKKEFNETPKYKSIDDSYGKKSNHNDNYQRDYKTEYSSAGLYEGGEYKKEQKVFRPTPIISPIYGILDKNYKKEEIVQKKEVRLTSASSKKMDLDSVREKAYGDLASDITASMMDGNTASNKKEVKQEEHEPDIENTLYDLSDNDHPVVSNVTVGDAEEYFNDLGLEYNVDYKDHKKDKASGRRSAKTKEIEEQPEDSLFDLIDSMYQESDEEEK